MGLYISYVEIENYRNFGAFKLHLHPVSVIVGTNKSGKTNLLRALRLALDPTVQRKLTASDFWCPTDVQKPFDGREIVVSVELRASDGNSLPLLDDALIPGEPKTVRFTYRFKPKTRSDQPSVYHPSDYEFIWYMGPEGPDKNRKEREVKPSLLQRISFEILHALRDTEDLLAVWSRSPLSFLLEDLNLDRAFLENVAVKIQTEAHGLIKRDELKQLADQIEKHSSQMVGDVFGIGSTFDILSGNADELLRSVRLFVDGPGPRQKPVSYASLGTLNILYFALLLEQMERQTRKVDPKQEIILALEEPEAHVHPHVQRSIFRYFLKNAEALIVTTHSPHIASVAELKTIAVLRDTHPNGTRSYSLHTLIDSDELTEEDLHDLERYLDVTRAEIIFARGVILVEGISELYVVPQYARLMGHDLDHLGISVISVHGTDFMPFVKMLRPQGFNIPFVVITDGDMEVEIDKAKQDSDSLPPGVERGYRLVDAILRSDFAELDTAAIDTAYLNQDADKVKRMLQTWGIFVGDITLEVDLIPYYPDEMAQAYDQLVHQSAARQSFRANLEGALKSDSEAISKVLKRIEDWGKGRYAQKLTPFLNSTYCPDYIADAIQRIVSILTPSQEQEDSLSSNADDVERNESDDDIPF